MKIINQRILFNGFSILKPKPKLTISQWADQNRYIARGTTPEPGRWRTSRVPYTREIMDTFNTSASLIVVCASSQVAKTEIALNIAGFYMHEDPSSIMYLMPTEGTAQDFSKTRIQPTIEASPVLKELFANSRESDNTIELKTFAGGYISIYGASTPTKLASKPIRILLADEIDRFLVILKGEGKPIKLAMQRTTNFFNRKILLISTPTVKNESEIEEWFEKSDKRYYYVPCPDCGHEFALTWDMMKWEADKSSELIPDSVYLECPACFYNITDKNKPEMLANGRWVKTAPQKTTPGFHISSLYSPWVKFVDLVREYIEAINDGGHAKLREFFNLKLGLSYEELVDDFDISVFENHKVEYGAELPDGVLYLTCGVDVQANRLEYQILGWGEGNRIWVIEFKMLIGDPERDEVWDSLDVILTRTYLFADGKKLNIGATCIDSGYLPDSVYKFTTPRETMRVAAIKGFGGEGIPIINNPTGRNRTHTKVMKVGVDAAKGVIYSRLRNHEVGNNYIHFPVDITTGCGDEYYKQLTSERRVLVSNKGKKRFEWKKIRTRNEALDTFVYGLAAYEMAAPDLQRMKHQLSIQITDYEILDDAEDEQLLISSGIKLY